MRIRLTSLLLILIAFSLTAWAQSANDRARAYYFQAEGMYESQNYDKTLEYLKEAEDLLGESNARIELLAVKALFAKESYQQAKDRVEKFYKYDSTDEMKREISSYLIQVDEKLEEIRQEQERQRIARERAAQQAEAARIRAAREKQQELADKAERIKAVNQALRGRWSLVGSAGSSAGTNVIIIPTGELTGYYFSERDASFPDLEGYADRGGRDRMDYSGAYSRMAEMDGRIFIKYSEDATSAIQLENRRNPISKKQNREYLLNRDDNDGLIYLGEYELVFEDDDIIMKERVLVDILFNKGWQYDLSATRNVDADGYRRFDIKADGPLFSITRGTTGTHEHTVNADGVMNAGSSSGPINLWVNSSIRYQKSATGGRSSYYGMSVDQLVANLAYLDQIYPRNKLFELEAGTRYPGTGLEKADPEFNRMVNRLALNYYNNDRKQDAYRLVSINAPYGDTDTQYYLGLFNLWGSGTPADTAQALHWFARAADEGHTNALCRMGEANLYGYGMDVNQAEGVRLMKEATRNPNNNCNYDLGRALIRGWGVEKADTTRGKELLTLAANGGSSAASYVLGQTWERQNRLGIARDWYRKAREQGSTTMQTHIDRVNLKIQDFEDSKGGGFRIRLPKIRAPRFMRGDDDDAEPDTTTAEWQALSELDKKADRAAGLLRQENYTGALGLIVSGAAGGHAPSQRVLGRMNYNGWGLPENKAEAFKLYTSAAQKGDPEARYLLARMYRNGEATEKNMNMSLLWYERAAEDGYLRAQSELAQLYYFGEEVTENEVKAFKWFEAAAEQGHINSAYFTGYMLYYGRGTLVDHAQAREWLELVADDGAYPRARFYLGEMYELGRGGELLPDEAVDQYEAALNTESWDEDSAEAALRLYHLYKAGGFEEDDQLMSTAELLDLIIKYGNSSDKKIARGFKNRM